MRLLTADPIEALRSRLGPATGRPPVGHSSSSLSSSAPRAGCAAGVAAAVGVAAAARPLSGLEAAAPLLPTEEAGVLPSDEAERLALAQAAESTDVAVGVGRALRAAEAAPLLRALGRHGVGSKKLALPGEESRSRLPDRATSGLEPLRSSASFAAFESRRNRWKPSCSGP